MVVDKYGTRCIETVGNLVLVGRVVPRVILVVDEQVVKAASCHSGHQFLVEHDVIRLEDQDRGLYLSIRPGSRDHVW